ncbi:hypothetical protein C8Q75DRAFT_869194 [Abortiporus biennis]|nr:hypothetical protein C8Q75DRAFT_869194 [Abortiporus biennis]
MGQVESQPQNSTPVTPSGTKAFLDEILSVENVVEKKGQPKSPQELLKTQYEELDHFFAASQKQKGDTRGQESRLHARRKLKYLASPQLLALLTDVFDEVIRRKFEIEDGEDQEGSHVSSPIKRDQARQKLSALSPQRFLDIVGDLHYELGRRYPELRRGIMP